MWIWARKGEWKRGNKGGQVRAGEGGTVYSYSVRLMHHRALSARGDVAGRRCRQLFPDKGKTQQQEDQQAEHADAAHFFNNHVQTKNKRTA